MKIKLKTYIPTCIQSYLHNYYLVEIKNKFVGDTDERVIYKIVIGESKNIITSKTK